MGALSLKLSAVSWWITWFISSWQENDEEIHKMTIIFTHNGQALSFWVKKRCYFVDLLKLFPSRLLIDCMIHQLTAQSLNKWNEPRNCPLTPGSDGPESGALHLFWRNIHRLGATKKLIGVHLLRDLSALQQWDKQILKLPFYKVHIFWEGHKILRNLHRRFVLCSASQIYGGDFAKFCGLLRIYEL